MLSLRETWCRPDEPILLFKWHRQSTLTCFDVKGFDLKGRPLPSLGRRAVRAAGIGALATVLFVVAMTEDASGETGGGSPSGPELFVFGDGAECAAATAIRSANATMGCWVFTPSRFAFVVRAEALEKDQDTESRSLLGRVRSVGTDLLDIAKGAAVESAATPSREPERIVSAFEFSPQQVTNVQLAWRKLPRKYGGGNSRYLRVTLWDGSGFDLGTWLPERALAMALGQQ
ncbi:hypothetical protein SAMN05444320_11531 [Streptoalloteichus hindustanus]|uniref:Uncharacterized protein n=1 Tax=Streptoalloteichus hindustanus TaxID=2017 RepID=A0A1M5N8L6_STRHI|nr:hypothetical protein SAMN05444320_11531 [Streptoalloteichus hindustanus]